jgi:hypothetical protein
MFGIPLWHFETSLADSDSVEELDLSGPCLPCSTCKHNLTTPAVHRSLCLKGTHMITSQMDEKRALGLHNGLWDGDCPVWWLLRPSTTASGHSHKKCSFQPMTAVDREQVQFEGRKRACIGWKQQRRLSKDGLGRRTTETTFGLDTYGESYY